jgi:hypothetical protein
MTTNHVLLKLLTQAIHNLNHTQPRSPTMTAYKDRLNAGHYQPTPTADQLEEQTVADLKAELNNRGLPTSGTKNELIERLATPTTEDQ